MADQPMLDEQTWKAFQEAGLLWWVNRQLHLFGWAIVLAVDEDDPTKVKGAFPARCKFRGFGGDSEERGFKRLTGHIRESLPAMLRDADVEPLT